MAEANRRIEVLKDLARYQGLVDEKGQRKAFDAQFQIATIVRTQLANPVKAIIEYRKVVTNWPESYVAASALYEIGTAYLGLGETAKAREALQAVGQGLPDQPAGRRGAVHGRQELRGRGRQAGHGHAREGRRAGQGAGPAGRPTQQVSSSMPATQDVLAATRDRA